MMTETVDVEDVRITVDRVPGSGAYRMFMSDKTGHLVHRTVYLEEGWYSDLADSVAAFVQDVHGINVRRDDYRAVGYYSPVAYAVDYSYYLCDGCITEEIAAAAENGAEWAAPVLAGCETDRPSFCDGCGTLIAEDLTRDGQEWVRDVITGREGSVNAANLVALIDAYGDAL